LREGGSHRSKTANIKFYLQIQSTDNSDHIYVSEWPVIKPKTLLLCLEFADKILILS